MSSTRQITYNTRSAGELLRCTNYVALHDPTYRMFLIVIAILGLVVWKFQTASMPISLSELIFFYGVLLAIPLVGNALVVLRLVKDPRNCTSSLTDSGVTDHTERSNEINLPWNIVREIRINNGNVYFFSWRQNVYIPAYAFASLEDATDFYNQAQKLWRDARDKKVAARITSFDDALAIEADTISRIQEFDDQEEAMWKEMEEKHQKPSDNESL